MLTITQADNRTEIQDLCARAGIPQSDKLQCFVARSRGEVLGFCLYEEEPAGIRILAVDAGGDGPLFDGLLRAGFWSASQRGIEPAEFAPSVDRTLLRQYRFLTDGTENVESMSEFLEQCKNCKN